MVSINIICVGKLKEKFLKDALTEYSKRVSRYCKLNIIELQDEKIPENLNLSIINEIKSKECKKIIEHIKKSTYVISLDLKGKQFTSEQFSEYLEKIELNSSSITFIIGGSLGLTNDVLNISNETTCISKMTFPHQLIRVFLLEQLFRAFKISKNETYHW